MSLYNSTDLTLLIDNWRTIMNEVEKQRFKVLEPTADEMAEVHKIICDFIKSKKRKIYGGYALNLLVKSKNPSDAFYNNEKMPPPDIDFYSPRPILDLMELCNILHEKGYKYVAGREAMHQETYTITANYVPYCDISYVPKNIYDRMPYQTIDGFTVIHPHFMMIDYLRMMTDPLISYWRFENDLKAFKRFFLLQKYFQFPISNYPIDIKGSNPALELAVDIVYQYVIDKKSLLMIGFYAYNYFLAESGLPLDNNKKNKFKLLNIPYFEMISTNYREDCLNLLETLKKKIIIKPESLSHAEHYPFFQFTDHSVEIFYDGDLIAKIYNNNHKCIPYQVLPAIGFGGGKYQRSKGVIRLAIFPTVLLYSIVSIMRARTMNNEDEKGLYYTVTSHLIEMRNHYFKANNKTMLDETIFREFIAECMGETIQPDRQRRLLIESRKKKNKRYTFTYEPADGIKEPESTYVFANTSGNIIVNPKNLRLASQMKEDDPEGDFDDEVFEFAKVETTESAK